MGGLETKAIIEINQAANQFQSSIVIQVGMRFIDVKSILGLSVTLFNNQTYKLDIQGPDEEEAKEVLKGIFDKHGLKIAER
ncbi:HPr family phosphocarrier protein [Paenibacillus sp. CGMCC 1.16610]|uniref:HPr family phosphocarrier protein n=1 Tax=Paenibacillus anseongense TaxID=2682845 RepID=A0ABW9UHA3_9BACL|nr:MULTISPECIES: HPr family phosphocarrier protein [Paenibacillus]MBA2939581.1 HPr family phosphocarrier protein [Paenibacillus sp. CGMCC 1.16610]MVQ39243.1 HPr family phosphocarrier protein [Paenibacillus anseongense]